MTLRRCGQMAAFLWLLGSGVPTLMLPQDWPERVACHVSLGGSTYALYEPIPVAIALSNHGSSSLPGEGAYSVLGAVFSCPMGSSVFREEVLVPAPGAIRQSGSD